MNKLVLLVFLASLSACSGNPLTSDEPATDPDPDPVTEPEPETGISRDGLPPGTTSPTRDARIVRYEPTSTADGGAGNGYVTNVRYNKADDTFQVDNLAFDGDNVYTRDAVVGSLAGRYSVYEGKDVLPDGFTGTPISQFQHRAVYGVSPDGNVEFAIVRTGQYVDYGFGGFIYQRNGGVVLPPEGKGFGDIVDNTDPNYRGQATYGGKYAGIRDFKARSGLEYATGDMTMDIDFGDFNDGNAVKGRIYNRAIFDIAGNDITDDIVSALAEKADNPQGKLPEILFKVGPGAMDANGEITGEVESNYYNGSGAVANFETGNYYAIVSGANAEQVVGIVVVEGSDPRYTGVTARETGGFILSRPGD